MLLQSRATWGLLAVVLTRAEARAGSAAEAVRLAVERSRGVALTRQRVGERLVLGFSSEVVGGEGAFDRDGELGRV
jgi:hypothetical protein